MTRRAKRVASICAVTVVIVIAWMMLFDRRSSDVKALASVRDERDMIVYGRVREGSLWTWLTGRRRLANAETDKAAALASLCRRCADVSATFPQSVGGLASRFLASSIGCGGDEADGVAEMSSDIEGMDLHKIDMAMSLANIEPTASVKKVLPVLIARVRTDPQHLSAARLVARVCTLSAADGDGETPPTVFSDAAKLIEAHFLASTDISGFSESLSSGYETRSWAGEFESQLRAILNVNQDRWVRCTAALALAAVVQADDDDRQKEAEQLYTQFIEQFDGQTKYHAQGAEREMLRRAIAQREAIRHMAIGQPAPNLSGNALDGRPISLVEYRGKVILVSFWATWCPPCMKMVRDETEIFNQLPAEKFAIVGVNGDEDIVVANAAVKKHQMRWRSFCNSQADGRKLSEEWNAFFPTVYLIDHRGMILKRWVGAPSRKVIESAVRRALSELSVGEKRKEK